MPARARGLRRGIAAAALVAASSAFPQSPTPVAAPSSTGDLTARAGRSEHGPFAPDPQQTGQRCLHPDYPPSALQARAEGETILGYTVLASGAIARVAIVQSTGDDAAHLVLDQAAFDAFASCLLTPAVDATGRPIDYSGHITYTWKIAP